MSYYHKLARFRNSLFRYLHKRVRCKHKKKINNTSSLYRNLKHYLSKSFTQVACFLLDLLVARTGLMFSGNAVDNQTLINGHNLGVICSYLSVRVFAILHIRVQIVFPLSEISVGRLIKTTYKQIWLKHNQLISSLINYSNSLWIAHKKRTKLHSSRHSTYMVCL